MATNSPAKQKVVKIQRWQIGLNVIVQFFVVCLITLLVNYLSYRHFKRWDFSNDRQYALSSQTKNLLASLQKPVHAFIYFSTAAELAPDLGSLLREYDFAANKKFIYEAVDPYRNPARAQELKDKYKIQDRDNIVILDYDGRSKFVDAADMAEIETPDQMQSMMGAQPHMKAFKGEGAITSALLELTAGKPNRVYLVTGHGESDFKGEGFQAFTELLKRQNIQTAPLNLLNAGKVPEDARSLLIYGPKYDLSEVEMKVINDFWENKGSFFICLNPYAKTPRLTAWLASQGVLVQDDQVIGLANFVSANEETGLPQFTKGVTVESSFAIPENSPSPIVKDLPGVTGRLLGSTQSLQLDDDRAHLAHLRLTPLMISEEGYWGETDKSGDLKKAYFDPQKDHAGPLTLAAAVEKGGVDDPRVKVEESRLIVVGNAEFLGDNEYQQSQGATGDFSMSGLNWLLAHEEAIGIPPKEKKTVTINLSTIQLRNIAWIAVGAIPGFIALLGVANWSLRRN